MRKTIVFNDPNKQPGKYDFRGTVRLSNGNGTLKEIARRKHINPDFTGNCWAKSLLNEETIEIKNTETTANNIAMAATIKKLRMLKKLQNDRKQKKIAQPEGHRPKYYGTVSKLLKTSPYFTEKDEKPDLFHPNSQSSIDTALLQSSYNEIMKYEADYKSKPGQYKQTDLNVEESLNLPKIRLKDEFRLRNDLYDTSNSLLPALYDTASSQQSLPQQEMMDPAMLDGFLQEKLDAFMRTRGRMTAGSSGGEESTKHYKKTKIKMHLTADKVVDCLIDILTDEDAAIVKQKQIKELSSFELLHGAAPLAKSRPVSADPKKGIVLPAKDTVSNLVTKIRPKTASLFNRPSQPYKKTPVRTVVDGTIPAKFWPKV